jgi:hypothetical protein
MFSNSIVKISYLLLQVLQLLFQVIFLMVPLLLWVNKSLINVSPCSLIFLLLCLESFSIAILLNDLVLQLLILILFVHDLFKHYQFFLF